MARAATPAIAALVTAGTAHQVLRYRHDPRNGSFGAEAAAALAGDDSSADQVFKTLVIAWASGATGEITGPSGLAVAVLPVTHELSLKAAASALGMPRAAMADRASAERSTGYVLGGISPLGQRKPLPTVLDASALRWDRVLCSAGKRGLEMALAPADLIRLTNAVTADILAS